MKRREIAGDFRKRDVFFAIVKGIVEEVLDD